METEKRDKKQKKEVFGGKSGKQEKGKLIVSLFFNRKRKEKR